VAPHYTKPGRGRRPMPLETMLRIYFLQQWFGLSDPQAENMLYDSESIRRFARVELGEDTVPDESTILRFRHLLETHQLTAQMFAAVRDLLSDHDLLVTTGTMVDATLIAAPSSTKNATKTRDPEMRQTRKGRSWHFGMKCYMGTYPQGFVHTLTTTDAAHSDLSQLPALVHGLEETRHGDKAYWKEADREAYEALGGQDLIHRRGERTPERDALNRERSRHLRSRICFARVNNYSRWARSVGVNAGGGRKRPPRPRIGAASARSRPPRTSPTVIFPAQLPTSFVLVTCAELP
jgi:IS5 family transposase